MIVDFIGFFFNFEALAIHLKSSIWLFLLNEEGPRVMTMMNRDRIYMQMNIGTYRNKLFEI